MADSKISGLTAGLALPTDELVTRRDASNFRVPVELLTDNIFNVKNYGAVGDNSTNDTTAIQAAIDAAAADGGGVVYIPAGTYVTGPLVIKNQVWIRGAGIYATTLKLADSSDDNLLTSYKATSTESNALLWAVQDLRLDGNKSNQASGSGIYVELSSSQTAGDVVNDARWLIDNVFIENCKEHGFEQVSSRSEGRIINLHVFDCDGHGFRIAGSDTFIVSSNVGACGLAGFYISGSSVRIVNSKAWFNGTVTSASGHGFHLNGSSPGGVSLTNCEAQDNDGAGFKIESSSHRVTLTGCVADSNGKGSTTPISGDGSYAGYEISSSRNITIVGCISYERRYDGVNSAQRCALKITSSAEQNNIDISHSAASGGAVVNQPLHGDSTSVNGNNIRFNAQGGHQAVSYASSITPNPYEGEFISVTLTGNITVNNVSNTTGQGSGTYPRGQHAGARMTFIFTQDGTGGHTVTWGDAYKVNWTPTTTANKINTISFVYNGSNWIQVGEGINL